MSGFVIDLATLAPGYARVVEEAVARDLGLPEADWVGPVRGTLDVEMSGERVSVRGWLDATTRLECARCLTPFEFRLEIPFESFAERSGTAPRREQDELERDAYMTFHDGRRLDLRTRIRENLLLEVPMTPHCREDCAGLCPRCGADLNLGPHECSAA
jgi:uncharacterized protein